MNHWSWILPLCALFVAGNGENVVVASKYDEACTTDQNEEGLCVYQYQCLNGVYSLDGSNIIDVRQARDDCNDYFMQCCKHPNFILTDEDQDASSSTDPTIVEKQQPTGQAGGSKEPSEVRPSTEGDSTGKWIVEDGGDHAHASTDVKNRTEPTVPEVSDKTNGVKPSLGGDGTGKFNTSDSGHASDPAQGGLMEVKKPGKDAPGTPVSGGASRNTTSQPWRPQPVEIPPYDLEGCGHRNPGGVVFTITNNVHSESEYGEYPWAAAVFSRAADNSLKYLCGGALIDRAAILTTASCIYGQRSKSSQLVVRLGEWDISTNREPIPHVDSAVDRVYLHPSFGVTSKLHDIAVVILHETVELGHTVGVVCLPPPNSAPTGTDLVGVGWGNAPAFVVPQKLPQTILKKAHLSHLQHAECQLRLHRLMDRKYQLDRSFLCAAAIDTEMLPCRGDTGSPYTVEIEPGIERYQLVGLSSWGYDCNKQNTPTVLTNVAYHREWIDEVIKKEDLDLWSYTYVPSHGSSEE